MPASTTGGVLLVTSWDSHLPNDTRSCGERPAFVTNEPDIRLLRVTVLGCHHSVGTAAFTFKLTRNVNSSAKPSGFPSLSQQLR
jgi:hypothetical protein